ncbi:MAG: iron-sulfur cluster assembly scaffold protein [Candidatus Diapherotrites archaeon]|uniref:Iron-sulfur cluster assembly scaffold protein n=1 Tax=Candidatus Iainarchaeum sp. TaxID=3101447 RepID=A0A8T4L406_9ARCH|nr:iron-sulfur cluster assembly scaffold protein [Candidatus Diapherotrites archaeon]
MHFQSPDGITTLGQDWFYSPTVKEHFFKPRNFLTNTSKTGLKQFNGTGLIGSAACGDVMRLWIKVDPQTEKLKECKWQTFGCGSAIASTSMLSVMVTENGGMKVEEALKITPQDILKRLGGLPARKIHCSVLGDKALRAAINDYFRQSGQLERVRGEGKKVIDKVLGITDEDIEHAVLEGAKTFEEVQHKTKVGVHDKACVPEVMQLIHYYRRKHFNED